MVEELQALADLHRGERVVVPVAPEQVAAVLEHLGRAARAAGDDAEPLRLEIGDDGWALVPPCGLSRAVQPDSAVEPRNMPLRRGGARCCRCP